MPKNTSDYFLNIKSLCGILGIQEGAIRVYISLLELGPSQIQEISTKSGIKRTSVYNLISALKENQLIAEIKKGKRKVYSAVSPQTLLSKQKEKMDSLEHLIPELLAIKKKSDQKPQVLYHEGIGGMKTVYELMLQDKNPIFAFEDLDRMSKVLPKAFFNEYPKKRSDLNIPFRSIVRNTNFAEKFVKKMNSRLSRQSVLIDVEELGTEINIFGSNVALFSLNENDPFSVLIRDKNIARTLKIIWEKLWNLSGNKL